MAISSLKRIVGFVFRTSHRLTRVALDLVRSGAEILATASETDPAKDELNSSIRGGVLNYRTGKLDDGTDPYGWYERD